MRPHLLALAAAAMAAMAASAGCLEAQPDAGAGGEAPITDLVLVRGTFTIATDGEGSIFGDVGAHCGEARVALDPLSVTLVAWDGNATPPEGLIVRETDADAVRNASGKVATIGVSPRAFRFSLANATTPLHAAFDPGRVLFEISTNAPHVVAAGKSLLVGETLPLRFEYEVEEGGATFRVVERFEVHRAGPVPVVVETPAGPCY